MSTPLHGFAQLIHGKKLIYRGLVIDITGPITLHHLSLTIDHRNRKTSTALHAWANSSDLFPYVPSTAKHKRNVRVPKTDVDNATALLRSTILSMDALQDWVDAHLAPYKGDDEVIIAMLSSLRIAMSCDQFANLLPNQYRQVVPDLDNDLRRLAVDVCANVNHMVGWLKHGNIVLGKLMQA